MQTRNILRTPSFVTPALMELNDLFGAAGFELVLVGGCVRDTLMGETPKDIDLATSATPEEQVALYQANGLRYIETGLQHGTVTVVLDGEPYEITTYRIDRETDGRHATVEYTRSLTQDLERRDLTMNAIAMQFDGSIFDPFDGVSDIENREVRFVGDADKRIEEDYLRILRYFRFFGRFGEGSPSPDATRAIRNGVGGLRQISVERVWMEVSKIISGPSASLVMSYMRDMGVFEVIGMPEGFVGCFSEAQRRGVNDPASLMGWFVIDAASVDQVADAWKWATEDRQRANFVASNRKNIETSKVSFHKELLVNGVPFEWVSDLMKLSQVDPKVLANWEVPKLPVTGKDLIEAGMKPGPDMGRVLNEMKNKWVASDYSLDKNSLMGFVVTN